MARPDRIQGNPRDCILDTYQEALNAINNPDMQEFITFFRSKVQDTEIFQSYILYFMGLDFEGISDRSLFDKRLLQLTNVLHVRLSSELYADILFGNHQIQNSEQLPDELQDGSYMSFLLKFDLEKLCKDKIEADLDYLIKNFQGKDGFTERHEYLLWQEEQNNKRIALISDKLKEFEKLGIFIDQEQPILAFERFMLSVQKFMEQGEDILEERLIEAQNIKAATVGSQDYADAAYKLKMLKAEFLEFVINFEKFSGAKPKDLIKRFNQQYKDYPQLREVEGKVSEKVVNPLLEGLVVGSSFVPFDEQFEQKRKEPLEHLDLETSKTKVPRELISADKSLSLQEFLHESCFNQKYGYYSNISQDLGFTTLASGYKTQLGFAAALLAKSLNHWIECGKPDKFMMLQLSGGNGELELSILSLAQIMASNGSQWWNRFYDALHFRTIDISPSLSERQRTLCEKYGAKFEVIHGDATKEGAWREVEAIGCGGHFVLSNELLDMTFPEIYGLSEDGKIIKPYVATKITDFNGFRAAVWDKIGHDSPAGKEFLKLSRMAEARDKKSPIPLRSSGRDLEMFINKNLYNALMVFLHDNGLRNDETVNKYFKHIIVDVPLELTAQEDRELRSRLFQEAPAYVKKSARNEKVFYTDSVAAKKIFYMQLPKQKSYHFDYFSDSLARNLGLLRHYGDNEAVTVLKQTEKGVEFVRNAPNLVDTTHSVSQIKGFDSRQHVSFLSSQDQVRTQEIKEVTGIDTDHFCLFSALHSEMKFVEIDGSRSEHPASVFEVRKAESQKSNKKPIVAGVAGKGF